jgi:hypothetical protein
VAEKNADFVKGSQGSENAHWHSTCSEGDSQDICKAKQRLFLSEMWGNRSMTNLAATFMHIKTHLSPDIVTRLGQEEFRVGSI